MEEHELVGEFDATVWAKEFMRVNAEHNVAEDEETMVGWFASAIMAGYDRAKAEVPAD